MACTGAGSGPEAGERGVRYGYGPHHLHGWGGGGILLLLMLVVFAAIVIGGVWLIMGRPRRADAARGPITPGPEQILAERLARGEIDAAEYRERLSALREPPPGG